MVKSVKTDKQLEWSDEEFEETKVRKKIEIDHLEADQLVRRMSLDRKNKIKSFTEIGLFDPFNKK
jgi:hypothetical protein